MNIRDLEYLVALDDFRHFRKAADHCCVSQPTLSAQIKKLEEDLSTQLIERSKRKVMLTPVGRQVVERARAALEEVRAIREIPRRFLDPMSGPISIGVFPTLAPYLLPRIIAPIKQQCPNLELRLVEAITDSLLQRLVEGTVDVLILALPIPNQQAYSNLQTISLFREPFYFAAHRGHRLGKRRRITLEDLDGESISLLEEGHCLRDQALDVCQAGGLLENSELRATSLETLRYMIEAGATCTLMPKLALPENKRQSSVCYIPFQRPAPEREIGMVFRNSSARLECFEKLAGIIRLESRKYI